MKLSEAMMLGASIVRMRPRAMSSCAYGAALHAVGKHSPTTITCYGNLKAQWPWLASPYGTLSDLGCSIYERFDGPVCSGLMTFEQLVDYVRSIEPTCGECNRFDCTCAAVTPEYKEAEVTA